ncbi:MAG: hypothetical protein K2J89_06085 [Clostridia bacterium]|nr:hypothetical protein [Clostridia bacterium]
MIVLVLITVLLYLSVWSTGINYLYRMKMLINANKKLRLTGNSLLAIFLEQFIAILGVVVFYAIKLNDKLVSVPKGWAVLFAVITCVGFVATGYFLICYRRKHFPEYVKRGEIEDKAKWLYGGILTVGLLVSVMNFTFNAMVAGAISYLSI